MLEEVTPTKAYDLLNPHERECVDDYVAWAVNKQGQLRERIALAADKPIPSEFVRKSRSALASAVVRAAVGERIREEAARQDISPDRIIQELVTIGTSKVSDFLTQVGLGELGIKKFEDIPEHLMGAVKSIETTPTNLGMKCKVVLHDKLPALKALAEMMGLVVPDRPPALREYVAPLPDKNIVTIEVAKAYEKFLDEMKR